MNNFIRNQLVSSATGQVGCCPFLFIVLGTIIPTFLLAQGRANIAVPLEIIKPPWMEMRAEAQLATANWLSVYNDFVFEDQLQQSGITFRQHNTADSGRDHIPNHYDHGNGVAIADVDLDGHYDIYFVTQVGSNQLWRNLGKGRFANITQMAQVGLDDRIGVTASFADTDNDGDPDLYVTSVRASNVLFENDGSGTFTNVTKKSGLGYVGHSSAATFFDYDRDGFLDLFLANVGIYTTNEQLTLPSYGPDGLKNKSYQYYRGHDDAFAGHLKSERGERSRLYRNLGNNQFVDVTDDVGIDDWSWSGDATTIDVNSDGWLDLYVLNMQGHDHYYENVDGRFFRDRTGEVFPKTPWGAMGVKVFDYDEDGMLDLYLVDMHSDMSEKVGPDKEKERNMKFPETFLRSEGASIYGNALYRNLGNGRYEEVGERINSENYWPWGFTVADLNADGYEDLFIASSMNYPFRYGVNSVLLNDRGRRFHDSEFILGIEPRNLEKTARPWFELDCGRREDSKHKLCEGREDPVLVWGAMGSRSSVIFDLDSDGDLDIVTNEFNGEPMVLISDLSQRNSNFNALIVKLEGTSSNRDALGSIVKVYAGGRVLTRFHDGKSGYLSQSSYHLFFGLAEANSVEKVEVIWPTGKVQVENGPFESNMGVLITEH